MEETCSIITATRWLTTGNWVALLSNMGRYGRGSRFMCCMICFDTGMRERTIDKKKKITVDDYMLQDPNPRLISGQQAVRTRGQSRRSGFPSFPSHPRPLI